MIQANELRLGSYFHPCTTRGGLTLPSTGIVWKVGMIDKFGKIGVIEPQEHESIFLQTNECEPVPLTEEWLVRFGCVEQRISSTKKNYWNKEKDFSVDVEFTVERLLFYYLLSGTDRRKHIMYVHKLQNIHFELKDEELEYSE